MVFKKILALSLAVVSVFGSAFTVNANDATVESQLNMDSIQSSVTAESVETTVGNVTYRISESGATMVGFSEYLGMLNVPASITYSGVAYPVVAIADGVGENNARLTAVFLSNASNLETIGERCFSYCTKLETVSFLSSNSKLKSIGNIAFYNCEKLSSVQNTGAQSRLEKVGSSVFGLTPFIKSQTDDFVMLGKVLVKYNGNEENVTVPADVVGISDAFFGTDVVSVDLGEKVKYIGNNAFYNCRWLESIELPASCLEIGDMAFAKCISLESVTYGELSKIGFCAFANCSKLESFTYVGEGTSALTGIGEFAFWNDQNLVSLDIGAIENVNIGAFWNCFGKTPIQVGEDKYYRIPTTVKTIAEGGYGNIGYTYITVPESVEAIANAAFGNATGLTKYIAVKGSVADKYFADNKLDYINYGDMNSDGKITFEDVKTVAQFIAGGIRNINYNNYQGIIADADSDNSITTKDLYDVFRSIKKEYEASIEDKAN